MGSYVRGRPSRKRSVSDTLAEAESEHLLDCPNADFLLRTASLLLDTIFLFLLMTGVNRIFKSVVVPLFMVNAGEPNTWNAWLESIKIAVIFMVGYYSVIGSLIQFGGSPAKLIVGLRVIDTNTGQKLSFIQAVLREVVGKLILAPATLGIGLLLPLFRSDSRALHDLISRSSVKRVRHHP